MVTQQRRFRRKPAMIPPSNGAPTQPPAGGSQDCAWLIRQFADEVPGVTHALIVSLDGLQLAASRMVPRDLGDQLSALTAGLLSMADRSAALLDLGASEYMTIRLPRGHLLFMRIGESAG